MNEANELKHAPTYHKPRVETVEKKPSAALPKPEVVKEKKFTSIEISAEQPKPAVRSTRTVQNSRSVKRSEPLKQPEYTFTPVISPIFGMDETTEPKHAKKAKRLCRKYVKLYRLRRRKIRWEPCFLRCTEPRS